jgi:uncharacterized protein YceH (UPF0502 family)
VSSGYTESQKQVSAPAFYASSDVRLKENIHNVTDENINKISNVDLKEFNFIGKDTEKYGVIAQEVENAGLSNLVSTNSEGYKSVDYTSLLILKIAQLEKELAELRKQINEK